MFEFTYSPDAVSLRLLPVRSGLLGRLMSGKTPDLDRLTPADRRLAFALADLRTLADSLAEPLEIAGDRITLSHRLAASLDAEAAAALGLPLLTDLTLRTDAEGVLGSAGFRLRHQWLRAGQQRMPRRAGAILETDRGPQRLPLWMLDAVVVAEGFTASTDDAAHWEALARFRKALEPGVTMAGDTGAARGSMTDFLQGLEV
ncbi:MAG: ATP-dependent helicase, partial [Cypionkella sp.]|nr:ATP-dependent helicase [Cypionkella sp.]